MSSLRDQIELLTKEGVPTTFLDALRLVRRASAIDGDDLQAILALHDAANTTDGARDILADFLRGRALSMAHEKNHADRLLTLDDSGRSVRGRKGCSIKVQLDTRAHRGGVWEVKNKTENLGWEMLGLDQDRRYTAGEIKLEKAGPGRIELIEILAPPKKSHARSRRPVDVDCLFTLDVLVEST